MFVTLSMAEYNIRAFYPNKCDPIASKRAATLLTTVHTIGSVLVNTTFSVHEQLDHKQKLEETNLSN